MSDHAEAATAFGAVAHAYHRGRPELPAEIVRWLSGSSPLRVLELGAGTGRLTAGLIELGHRVHATDPDERMLDVLSENLPDVPVAVCSAEEIDAADSAYDLVVCADALQWFDLEKAFGEIVRVLAPEGRFAAVTLRTDTRIPWVKKLDRVMEGKSVQTPPEATDPIEALELSTRFGFVEQTSHAFWQVIDSLSVVDLALTHPAVAQLEPQKREQRLDEVRALYDDYGRGMDGMQLPVQAVCVRTKVLNKPQPPPPQVGPPVDREDTGSFAGPVDETNPRGKPVPPIDETGDDLLIDFR